MQIDRVTATAAAAAAIILGLLLLSPQLFPAQGSGDYGKGAVPAGPSQSPVVTFTTSITLEPVSEAASGSGNLWANVDPVQDIRISRPGTITIHGTTNVQPGEVLKIDLIAYSMHPSPMEYNPELWVSSTANVMKGGRSINTWSVEIRPEDFKKPDQWQILVNDERSGQSIGSGSVNVTI